MTAPQYYVDPPPPARGSSAQKPSRIFFRPPAIEADDEAKSTAAGVSG